MAEQSETGPGTPRPLMPHGFRGGMHYGVGVVVGAMGLYNLGRFVSRTGHWGHALNTAVYLGACALEGYQLFKHVEPTED